MAVVLPTNTWQAYNLYDSDGDGWGDTWYAGGAPPVVLDRPYRDRGVPPRFFRYDFPFLRWLEKTRREADVYADDDLERFATGDELRRLYDLVVFPGHSEYMTEHAYDVVERFRDLGGRLVFLSANNFFWKVERRGRRSDASASGGHSAGLRRGSWASSTGRTTTAAQGPFIVRDVVRRAMAVRGDRASGTATSSATRSAASGSRST